MKWTFIKYISERSSIKFDPMERWNKKQMSWITNGLMFGSIFLWWYSTKAFDFFMLTLAWLTTWMSGQFWCIVSNWDELESDKKLSHLR